MYVERSYRLWLLVAAVTAFVSVIFDFVLLALGMPGLIRSFTVEVIFPDLESNQGLGSFPKI
jgi:hypothetical protein